MRKALGRRQLTVHLLVKAIGISMFVAFLSSQALAGEPINIQRLANAIYKAENSKTHPYGIIPKYKHTTPRQACINTIKHALKDWNHQGDFILFLSKRYCPIGAKNDPKGLNKNWVKNVRYYYELR